VFPSLGVFTRKIEDVLYQLGGDELLKREFSSDVSVNPGTFLLMQS
jgi:hypothetical protein